HPPQIGPGVRPRQRRDQDFEIVLNQKWMAQPVAVQGQGGRADQAPQQENSRFLPIGVGNAGLHGTIPYRAARIASVTATVLALPPRSGVRGLPALSTVATPCRRAWALLVRPR